jgi:uncharacterized protein YciI
MLWIISCIDKPNSLATRLELLPAHRKYLDTVNHQIFFSGPQEKNDGSEMVGSFFIVNAPDRAGAEAFIHGETLYQAGVFESVYIRRIRKGRFHPDVANEA